LMESEIRSYKPKQDDLAYPDKLIGQPSSVWREQTYFIV
jgi:hypothetical protein